MIIIIQSKRIKKVTEICFTRSSQIFKLSKNKVKPQFNCSISSSNLIVAANFFCSSNKTKIAFFLLSFILLCAYSSGDSKDSEEYFEEVSTEKLYHSVNYLLFVMNQGRTGFIRVSRKKKVLNDIQLLVAYGMNLNDRYDKAEEIRKHIDLIFTCCDWNVTIGSDYKSNSSYEAIFRTEKDVQVNVFGEPVFRMFVDVEDDD